MSATDKGAPDPGVTDAGSGVLSDTFSQNIAEDAPLAVVRDNSSAAAGGDILIERCAQLVVHTRRMLLAGLHARAVQDADAQWLIEQLVVGLAPAQDADLGGWLEAVQQMATQSGATLPTLGSPSGDHLRYAAYLSAPTWEELEELVQRVAALARQLPAPHSHA